MTLRDYRATTDRTVELAPSGVTVIEGPNEVGKSSIPEAIDHVLDDVDSSGRRELHAVRPVDRDVGPEVTIEVETGPYAFTYRKRFLRQPITELRIHRPRPEHLTGRTAHDRVQAILRETVDVALWRALRVQQGDLVGQATLAHRPSLSQALDRAAGEAIAGDEEHSLFGAAHAEYLRFWTETGRHRQDEVAQQRSIAETDARIERITAALTSVEADVESSVRLRSDLRPLTERRAELRSRVEGCQARVDALAALEAGVAAAEARHQVARLAADAARTTQAARCSSVEALGAALAERARLDEAVEGDAERLAEARAALVATDEALRAARSDRDHARGRLAEAEARLARERDAAELADLEGRYARGRAANAAMTAAAGDAALPVGDDELAAIREAHRAVELARARLEASRPHVRIDALAPIDGSLGGRPLRLGAGEVVRQRVDRELTIALPGVASIVVSAGSVGDGPDVGLVPAEARLGGLLGTAGATDLADAERIHARREAASRLIAEQRRIRDGVLRGESAKSLAERIVDLRGRLAQDAPVTGEDRDTPDRDTPDHVEAVRRLEAAEATLDTAERSWEAARTASLAVELAAGGHESDARRAAEEVARREETLRAERDTIADEQVAEHLVEAEASERAAAAELVTTRGELAGEGPEEARQALADAKRALDQLDVETRLAQDRLLEVTARLRDHGEDGLAEDLVEEQSNRDHLEAELRRYRSQAAARRLLYETLRDERDRAQRSYVAPLRREIERLGRIVFGDGFSVELDESSLEVTSRTLDGRTIPFASLSVGAQEQLAIIGRLACATIVAPDGGVPVILDDALGNSDPGRLAAMGEVLTAAGEQCQIVVLTCQPDRYEEVRAAKVVRLG